MKNDQKPDFLRNALRAGNNLFGLTIPTQSVPRTGNTIACTYIVPLDPHGDLWIKFELRGLSAQYELYYLDELEETYALEYSADLELNKTWSGNISSWVYNTIDRGLPLTCLFSADKFQEPDKYLVGMTEGTFTHGDTPPWKHDNYFLGTRTRP